MDTEAFWTLLGEFGPGFVAWQRNDELCSRPVVAAVDRRRGEIGCIVEKEWLPAFGMHESILLTFVDEFSRRGLAIQGRGLRSTVEEDLAEYWGAIQEGWYGSKRPGVELIALRISPRRAQLWDLSGRLPLRCWRFDSGLIGDVPIHEFCV